MLIKGFSAALQEMFFIICFRNFLLLENDLTNLSTYTEIAKYTAI